MGLIGILFARKTNLSSRRITKASKLRRSPWLETLENRCLLSNVPLATPSATEAANIVAQYDQIPLSFVPNAGQMAAPVQFSASGSGYLLFLTATGADFCCGGNIDFESAANAIGGRKPECNWGSYRSSRVHEQFLHRPGSKPMAEWRCQLCARANCQRLPRRGANLLRQPEPTGI